MKIACLLYALADFAGMLWTGYHSLFLIVSFWLALVVFYALASWSHYRGTRKYRHILRRAMQREDYR
jgi:hypothetical protein